MNTGIHVLKSGGILGFKKVGVGEIDRIGTWNIKRFKPLRYA
jgi:hypothetical protein